MKDLAELQQKKDKKDQELTLLTSQSEAIEGNLKVLNQQLKEQVLDKLEIFKEVKDPTIGQEVFAELKTRTDALQPLKTRFQEVAKLLGLEAEDKEKDQEGSSMYQAVERIRVLEKAHESDKPTDSQLQKAYGEYKILVTKISEEIQAIDALTNEYEKIQAAKALSGLYADFLHRISTYQTELSNILGKIKEKMLEIGNILDEILQVQDEMIEAKGEESEQNNNQKADHEVDDVEEAFDSTILHPGPLPPAYYPLGGLRLTDHSVFMIKLDDITESDIFGLMDESALVKDEENKKMLQNFKGNLDVLYELCSILGKVNLTQENFEAMFKIPEKLGKLVNLTKALMRHDMDMGLIFRDLIRYSPWIDSIIAKVPKRETFGQPSLTQQGFENILQDINLQIKADSERKYTFLRGFREKNLEKDSKMSILKTDKIADPQLPKLLFSFLGPSRVPLAEVKELKTACEGGCLSQQSGNNALFKALETSPFNPARIKVLLEIDKDDLIMESAAALDVYRVSDKKSFVLLIAEKLQENPKDPGYFEALSYLMQRMTKKQADETLPDDLSVILDIVEKNPELLERCKDQVAQLRRSQELNVF
ncbi:MAG: hypothetical protein QM752_01730 [Gammaproteobacteria bacterium]